MARMRSRDLFPTDEPIPSDRMIGRADDVAELARSLENGLHRIIAGPRRTGKTTVCRAALERVRSSGLYVAEASLFDASDAGELAETIVAATVANRSGVQRALHRMRQAGGAARRTVEAAAVMKLRTELGDEVEIVVKPGVAHRDPDRYLRYALDLPQRVAEADDTRIVLFLDEFQEIAGPGARYGDPDTLTKRMRAILQDSPHVTCLFAGSVEHLMRDLFAPSQRAFYQFGGFFELGPIDADIWAGGIRARFAEDDCEVEETSLWRIVELGESHPRATMLIAQQTHESSLAYETREIDGALVAQGLAAALAIDRPNHELTLTRVRDWRTGRNAIEVLKRVARGEPVYGDLKPKVAQRAVHSLRDAGIIESLARGRWQVTDPLLRRYLVDLEPVRTAIG